MLNSQSSSITNDKIEIFGPVIDFGEWCQQREEQKAQLLIPLHKQWTNNDIGTKTPWREIQHTAKKQKQSGGAQMENSNISTGTENYFTLPFTILSSDLLCSKRENHLWFFFFFFRVCSWHLRASFMGPVSRTPYMECLMTCRAGYPVAAAHRNNGKGRACSSREVLLCETVNRYRTEVIFFWLGKKEVKKSLSPAFYSAGVSFYAASYQALNNLQNTVPWNSYQ